MTSSAKSVRSDIISAINRDDRLQGLGRSAASHVPLGHPRLLNDASHSLNGSTRMSGALLRNPSQTFFKKEILPSSADLSVEDGPQTQTVKSLESAVVEDGIPWQEGAPKVAGSFPDEDKKPEESQEHCAVSTEDKGSEKSDVGRSDRGSLDTESSLSLQNHPIEPPRSPENRDEAPAAAAATAGEESPVSSLHEAESFSGTSNNIDFELEIFVDKDKDSPREPEETPSRDRGDEDEGDAPAAAQEGEESRTRRRGSLEIPQHTVNPDGNGTDTQQLLPSVLRSNPGGRARSSSVGHKVRFIGQCSFGESDDPTSVQDDSRASRRHGHRPRKKVHRSASVTGMDGDEREAATTRREYHTLLREIQALMSEVQRQRSDFRTELRSLASTIIRRHNPSSARPCVCSTPRRTSRLPVMMSEQDAAKEVKKGEEKAKDEAKEEKEERDEGRASSRASAGTSTPEPKPEENGEDGTPKFLTLKEQFRNFSKFGDTKSDGKMMTLSQADKWFKQAKVIDGKTISTTDTAITFNKFKTKKITFTEFEKYLDEIGKSKKVDATAIKTKLQECGAPGTSGTTSVVKSSAVDRLTDTKKFTGSHKLRFDSTGRGKGISGRKDVSDGSGYVTGYKNKNTYDKSH